LTVNAPTFRDTIAAFRATFQPTEEQAAHWKGRLTFEVLDNWARHPQCEQIWGKLGSGLAIPPAALIATVLFHRFVAEEAAIRIRAWPALEKKLDARAKRHIRDKTRRQLEHESALAATFTETRDRMFGRKVASGPRKRFMVGLTAKFKERSGQPFNEEVAYLTEIAFGGEVTVDMVRGTSKPTRDRDIRPPK
jgi:hypothetical protein